MTLDILAEFEALIVRLERDGIPFAVCGGLAVNIHGHVRSTLDIDLLVPPEALDALMAALADLGFTIRAGPIPFAAGTPSFREVHRATKIAGPEALMVDALLVTPILRDVWSGRQIVLWHEHPVPTVSRDGLIAMKKLAGRHQDLADIENLEQPRDE